MCRSLTWLNQIQTGDPTGTGSGGESCWGTPFRDEYDMRNAAKHDERGILAMANKGPATNGSQFYLTFRATPHLDKKHTVFGKLVGGEDVLDALEALPVKPNTERPAKPVRITEVVMCVPYGPRALEWSMTVSFYSYQDPFEEYKIRAQKKRARKAEAEENARSGNSEPMKDEHDELNWFGVKIGSDRADATAAGGGIGKYLSVGTKRSADGGASVKLLSGQPEEPKKKRRIGFGDFDGW